MPKLLAVSILWAFSFGLIKTYLTGIDATEVAFIRLALAFLVFLPFLSWKLDNKHKIQLMLTGAVQYGLMYMLYIAAFEYLKSYEIALLTIFTPLFVMLIHDGLSRHLHSRLWLAAFLSTLGAGLVIWNGTFTSETITGVMLMQASNLCFAIGQVVYVRLMGNHTMDEKEIFGYLYAGGVLISGVGMILLSDSVSFMLSGTQWLVMVILGIVMSGIGFFWWNSGARHVNAGTLAVMNNLKIPLAVMASVFIFNETANWTYLLIGGGLIGVAIWVSEGRKGTPDR